jgi:predicted dehydrogenase
MRVAVVGLGIGRTHVDRYARIPEADLVAVCDVDRALAERIAGERGCRAFADPTAMLDELRPDAVSICTPPRPHPELSEGGATPGVHGEVG